MNTSTYLQTHPVFSLSEAKEALANNGAEHAIRQRLKYHMARGRLKSVGRGVYASIPPGVDPTSFLPDPFLVAATIRSDAVFSHHSALELLGVAHSAWSSVTVLTNQRRRPLPLGGTTVRFIQHPQPLARGGKELLGVRRLERGNRALITTGPERTLADCFHRLDLAGGLDELVDSAAGFAVLDLDLLGEVLRVYDSKTVWAAIGWFLERYQNTFYVPEDYLVALQRHRPKSPHYLVRNRRGGELNERWNVIVPESQTTAREPDEN